MKSILHRGHQERKGDVTFSWPRLGRTNSFVTESFQTLQNIKKEAAISIIKQHKRQLIQRLSLSGLK